jgi:hypothetical protein
MLYLHRKGSFTQYDRTTKACSVFGCGIPTDWQPTPTSLPVMIQSTQGTDEWILDQSLPTLVPQTTPTITATFSEYIDALTDWENPLFESLDLNHQSCYDIIRIISAQAPSDSDLDI